MFNYFWYVFLMNSYTLCVFCNIGDLTMTDSMRLDTIKFNEYIFDNLKVTDK